MRVFAGAITGALKPIKKLGRTSKARFVTLNFDAKTGRVSVEEAAHGKFSTHCEATGDQSLTFQVDGHLLLSIVERVPATTEIDVFVEAASIRVAGPKSRSTIPRIDAFGSAGITTPIPAAIRGHQGKVEAPLSGRQIAPPKGDTWDFSAQVPFKSPADEPHRKD